MTGAAGLQVCNRPCGNCYLSDIPMAHRQPEIYDSRKNDKSWLPTKSLVVFEN
jgi:hypothetical protein